MSEVQVQSLTGSATALQGRWRLRDPSGPPGVVIEFELLGDGRLLHSIRLGTETHLTCLVFRVEADLIISRAVSEPEERRIRFELRDGLLRLESEAEVTWYQPVPTQEPG